MGEAEVTRGGKVIAASNTLEEILEELEMDLLMADMSHDAVTDVMTTLRGSLIGARIARKADLSEVIESALRNSLLSCCWRRLLEPDKTVRSFADTSELCLSIMMVGVNGTGKTTTDRKNC